MRWFSALIILLYSQHIFAGGKLLATPGVSQIEGSAGGGIVPWAQLAGYASEDEWAMSGFCSRGNVKNYRLDVCGIQGNLFDRVELSYAEQNFDVPALKTTIKQKVSGAKVRLYGDIVYSTWPQLSFGMQHKSLKDGNVAKLLGANDTRGNDIYLAASKLHLGVFYGYNWFWNVTARYSEANQIGLLGFGGDKANKQWLLEASSAVFLSREIALGVEFREKPNNLGLGETHWRDIFIAWLPNKSVSITAAWLDLGSIAGVDRQTGWYVSITGYF
ncbi:hypothetical protein PSECIP111951_01996 [Pseudoalteromonas holothuriae]|uniref:DUF3034 domain-containing protein n=1 Tax=Pseudoalteromonas holothuriae TaxID=2963714 RepID=A0A9W4VXN2_9GAMM|nr:MULTISPECIES: DUF3034 family protein [unclassified Pseudoalteromonas]CAH9054463.1 hypothetical protein PSECIP111854_01379 [Pseudoalteromonas sp. CIP111854]CAH9059054.1 hypothetical protein PSECIP111951_01996 [Pseudoalteromonas sp. CIP111951]